MAKKTESKKLCFIVGPIGDDSSEDRMHADWLLEEIIEPVFAKDFPDFEIKRADKISDPGRIDSQVITALLDADLVIADLTTLNPNAFYEIGIRHTVQKPIIHMHLEGQRIPFDIASFRSIKFDRKWPRDLKNARIALHSSITAVLADGYEVDNPVTFSRGKVEFDRKATPTEKVLQDQVYKLSERLRQIESLPPNQTQSERVRALADANFRFPSKLTEDIAKALVARPATKTLMIHAAADAPVQLFWEFVNGVVERMENAQATLVGANTVEVRFKDTFENANVIHELGELVKTSKIALTYYLP
ncbi:hypothetical protein [Rhizobium sp. S163]|uniref:hypothetical protein n=1 Tax=Rhizobium sp. S163 TaxID=3055039 RepID=UPI0025A99726|nr:hypothetical protein [Rhizobium sp. S163]MDM9647741.1 hypothetical protein [Rhizobium sp. S163]